MAIITSDSQRIAAGLVAGYRSRGTSPSRYDHLYSPRPARVGIGNENSMTMNHLTVGPFGAHVPEEALDDLRRRLAATRWPSKELIADRPHTVRLATLQELARYWRATTTGVSARRG